jgi:hypothetical protein
MFALARPREPAAQKENAGAGAAGGSFRESSFLLCSRFLAVSVSALIG